MTQSSDVGSWQLRSADELTAQQVAGVQAWHEDRTLRESAASVAADSREARQELGRRMDVIRRSHDALLARTETRKREIVDGTGPGPRRVVLAHRQEWFRKRMSTELATLGLEVLAELDNGADAVGVTVAEQPDLLFVEDSLPMVPGEAVIREVLHFSPCTVAAVQVGYEERIPTLYEAGAAVVFRRQVPPGLVARELGQLVFA